MHESILVYRNLRYLKLALAILALSIIAYVFHDPVETPNGGTWLGYTLGGLAAVIMIFLAWFGVRKRKYGSGRAPLADWLSAHVYFGLALIVIATLHAGFQFGYNIHTVLYVLMIVAIVSGMIGVYFYIRYPKLLTENRRGLSTELMLAQIADLDREIRQIAMSLDDQTNTMALEAAHETIIGGNLLNQLRGYDLHCPTSKAREFVEHSQSSNNDTQRRQLLTRLVRKEELLTRFRRDIQLRSWLKVWLYIHVPFSVASLTALATHVITVFYYW